MNTATQPREAGWEFPHIGRAQALGPSDEALVDDLRAVLEKHNALERFGIALLHQHFPIAEDEVLCENVDVANRLLATQPIKKSEVDQDPHTITLWSLREPRPLAACVCKDYGDGHSHFSSPTVS